LIHKEREKEKGENNFFYFLWFATLINILKTIIMYQCPIYYRLPLSQII
jgi:hypothetical protein